MYFVVVTHLDGYTSPDIIGPLREEDLDSPEYRLWEAGHLDEGRWPSVQMPVSLSDALLDIGEPSAGI